MRSTSEIMECISLRLRIAMTPESTLPVTPGNEHPSPPGTPRTNLKVVGCLILGAAVFVFLLVHGIRGEAVAAAHQMQLENMARAVPSFPHAIAAAPLHASHKSTQSLVGVTYRTGAPFAEIRAYYDTALQAHGWTFASEQPIRDWGRDLGGRSVTYKNGVYSAELQYAGQRAKYGWDYALDFSWGLH